MAHTTAFDPHRKTDWRIDPANVALLVIDMENDVLLPWSAQRGPGRSGDRPNRQPAGSHVPASGSACHLDPAC